MRGTRCRDRIWRSVYRIIPAHAGNSVSRRTTIPTSTDHPRACGELTEAAVRRWFVVGSSPRMRGTPWYTAPGGRRVRIIPAHAGNSSASSLMLRMPTDHPRACGELFFRLMAESAESGSSPRMRGTHGGALFGKHILRIIPAHAGNSRTSPARTSMSADHPRACGELSSLDTSTLPSSGSSPRMRGTQPQEVRAGLWHRIIPAHAGNSLWSAYRASWTPDHPRACGELGGAYVALTAFGGSSPRMRGTQLGLQRRARSVRIIPAHAGNSRPWMTQRPSTSDHPRACGELYASRQRLDWTPGSSPRMRGTLHRFHAPDGDCRIIPAHAGNSGNRYDLKGGVPDHPRACGELGRPARGE